LKLQIYQTPCALFSPTHIHTYPPQSLIYKLGTARDLLIEQLQQSIIIKAM
jgi:hypothetical protein